MVLVPPEPVDLQALQPARIAVEQPRVLEDLLEEERVGVVEQREVDLALGHHRLQVVEQRRPFVERHLRSGQQDGEIDVARRVERPARGRAELEEQQHPVAARDRVEVRRVEPSSRHRGDYRR